MKDKVMQRFIDNAKNREIDNCNYFDIEVGCVKEVCKCESEKSYSEEEVLDLLHRAVNDSHCSKDRVKFPSSNNCAEFVIKWFNKIKK